MKKILVIDDAATVRMYHRNILESAGYERAGSHQRDRGAGESHGHRLRLVPWWT